MSLIVRKPSRPSLRANNGRARRAVTFQRAGLGGEPRGDLVAAVQSRWNAPGAEPAVTQHIGLSLGIVAGDLRGLTRTRSVDDGQYLIFECDHVRVDRVTRHGNDQVVLEASPDTRVVVLREELVVGDDRRHPYHISLVRRRCRYVVLEERIESRRTTKIDRAAPARREHGARRDDDR